ncbi:MAG: DUF190 domain-containing protein [Magnetococcales bacterium]|nr:DUF190 domain-containing protein [Magnetococcales bacterium]
MRGYVITFFTQQDRRHRGELLGEWMVNLAREMGLPGATLIAGSMGYGHHRRIHSSHFFFELADQPQEIQMAVSEEGAERLFERLRQEEVHVFFIKTPVEYGTLGEAES